MTVYTPVSEASAAAAARVGISIDIASGLQFAMIFLYLVLAQLSFFQFSRLVYNKHPLLSFQSFFLFISLIWCGERAITFIWSPILTQSALTFLWILPSVFQCISFSLLVLYSRFLLNQHRWSQDRFSSLVVYFSIHAVLVIATLTIASLLAWPLNNSQEYVYTIEKVHSTLYALQFTLLLCFYAYYAYHLRQNSSNSRNFHQQTNNSNHFWVSLIAWCVFFSQWLYYILATIDPKQFRLHISAGNDNILDIQWPIFLVLIIWEIVPTSLVLFVSRHIPHSDHTIVTEIKHHGFFHAIFCCPQTRLGPSSIYNLTAVSSQQHQSMIDLNDPSINLLYGMNGGDNGLIPGGGRSGHGGISIFGDNSQIYPHQASYQVLNDGIDTNQAHTDPTGADSLAGGVGDNGSSGGNGLLAEYGLEGGNGVGSTAGDRHQQQGVASQLQSYSNHVIRGAESLQSQSGVWNSDLRGLPTTTTTTTTTNLMGKGKNNNFTSKQHENQQLQQQQQQGQGRNDSFPGKLDVASPKQHQNQHQLQQQQQQQQQQQMNLHPSDLIQLQMKSQLNQHLATYDQYGDGGDLF